MRVRSIMATMAAGALVLSACSSGDSDKPADGGDNTTATQSESGEAGGEAGEAKTVDLDFVTIATGGTSGPYYQIGATMAKVLTEKGGADGNVQSTGASVENITLLKDGKVEVAFAMGDATRQAHEGTGPFEGRAVENLYAITALYPNFVQIVTTDKTGIKSVKDLAGKRVGVGDRNSGVELNAQMILEAHGMSYDDIDEDFLSYSAAIDQIKNGQVDAAFVTSGLPNSAVMDLATTASVVVVPIEGEGMAALQEKYPFFKADVVPGGTYSQDEDVPTASIMNQLLVAPKLSNDEVYTITKTLFDNIDEIHGAHKAAEKITLDSVEDGLAVELHPGAAAYFKEVGALDDK